MREATSRTRAAFLAQAGAVLTARAGLRVQALQAQGFCNSALSGHKGHGPQSLQCQRITSTLEGTRGSTTNRSHAVVRAPSSALGAGDTRAKRTQAEAGARGQGAAPAGGQQGRGSSGTPTVHVPRDLRPWHHLEWVRNE